MTPQSASQVLQSRNEQVQQTVMTPTVTAVSAGQKKKQERSGFEKFFNVSLTDVAFILAGLLVVWIGFSLITSQAARGVLAVGYKGAKLAAAAKGVQIGE